MDQRRAIPRTDAVLADSRLVTATSVLGKATVKRVVLGRPCGKAIRGTAGGSAH